MTGAGGQEEPRSGRGARRSPGRVAALTLPGVLLWGLAPAAHGATDLVDRLEVTLAAQALSADTTARVDPGDGRLGTEVDFEELLGLDRSTTTLAAELAFRLGRRNQLSLLYADVDRSGDSTLTQPIVFGGETFPAGLTTRASFDLRRVGLLYTRWAVLHPRFGLGLSLGVVETELEAALAGRLRLGPIDLELTESVSASAPLPLAGLELRGAPAERLRLRAFLRLLRVDDVDGWSGDLTDLGATAEGRLLPHLWLGGGYTGFALDVRNEAERIGQARIEWSGWQLYARLGL